ncbi:MAG: glycosyltransferase family 1 protein [Firmicutes bacterium]|nr:glycosyltransferase family 1 protein [Bacillota bacterium]
MKEKISKLVNVYKKYGFKDFCKKLYAYIKANYLDKISFKVLFNKKKYVQEIQKILNGKYDRIILWRSSFGYNVPLFQRPQHIANNLSKNNCLVLYEVTTMTDKVKTLKKQSQNIYLFNFNNILLNKILMKELEKNSKPKYIQLYSTDWKLTVQNIKDYITKGFRFIYEYIDHLSPELAGTKDLPQNIIDKYEYAMNNKEVYVVVTADELKKDVVSKRGEVNLIESSNGVDYQFFKKMDSKYQVEEEFLNIIQNGKINICYYGALAKWFDYDLVKSVADTNKYNIILFGIKYDESYDEKMGEVPNVYFMGPRDYKVLKNYASLCDILTIPFVLNDITKSTSPVKIFEYMALHKPIVTTDMLECRKYQSVMIGKGKKDFLKKLEEAYQKKDNKSYIQLLDKEAKENDWSMKAEAIINVIQKDEK